MNYVLRQLGKDDNIAAVDANIFNIKQAILTVIDYFQQQWMKILSCRFVYNEQVSIVVSVEGLYCLICQALCEWWAKHQHALLEDLERILIHLLAIKETMQEAKASWRTAITKKVK